MMKETRTVGEREQGMLGNRHEKIWGVDIMIKDLGYIDACIYYNSECTHLILVHLIMCTFKFYIKRKKLKQKL